LVSNAALFPKGNIIQQAMVLIKRQQCLFAPV